MLIPIVLHYYILAFLFRLSNANVDHCQQSSLVVSIEIAAETSSADKFRR